MEGSGGPASLGVEVSASRGRLSVASDVARFILGGIFIVLGAGLLLEGIAGSLYGSRLFLDDVNRVFEFFVGLMSVTLGGLTIAGMNKAPVPGERKAT